MIRNNPSRLFLKKMEIISAGIDKALDRPLSIGPCSLYFQGGAHCIEDGILEVKKVQSQ